MSQNNRILFGQELKLTKDKSEGNFFKGLFQRDQKILEP